MSTRQKNQQIIELIFILDKIYHIEIVIVFCVAQILYQRQTLGFKLKIIKNKATSHWFLPQTQTKISDPASAYCQNEVELKPFSSYFIFLSSSRIKSV